MIYFLCSVLSIIACLLFRSLCCVYFLDIPRFDYPFGIFKLFLYILLNISNYYMHSSIGGWDRGRDRMVVGFTN